jgi:DNA-binding beta-propeller fold protein YncE
MNDLPVAGAICATLNPCLKMPLGAGRAFPVGLLLLFASLAIGAGGEVSFKTKPAVSREGNNFRIAFAVSAPTDVEVAVLGNDGKVARHLAAGMLGGPKPPPEPLQAGLSQSVVWDRRDDLGQAVADGPLKVRVRAGTGVKFGRFLGESPCVFGRIVSLAADATGNLFIMGYGGNRNQNFRAIRVFDGEGRYLREIMPFPADLPPEAMKDVAAWDAEASAFHPRNLNSLNPEFYSEGKLTLVAVLAGKRVAGGQPTEDSVLLTDGEKVYTLGARGGVPGAKFVTQELWPKNGRNPNTGNGPVFLAASPDGKYLYLSGPFSSKTRYGHEFKPDFPPGRIYRIKLGAGETMQPFATIVVEHQQGEGGAYRKHNKYYNDGVPEGPVHGVAVDAQGNVYVADRERERVAVFDESGRELGAIAVPNPHQLAIHPKSGEVFVLSRFCAGYWQYDATVSKFKNPLKESQLAARHQFPRQKGGWPQMALVAAEGKTAVYAAGVTGDLACLLDKGGELLPVATAFAAPAEALDVFNRLAVDAPREEVYVSDGGNLFWRFDGRTGEGQLLKKAGKPFYGTDLAVGYDGLLYVRTGEGFSGPLERFTRELEPAPYPTGTHVLSKYIYGRYGIGNCEKGLGVGPDGKVYVAFMYDWVKYCVAGFGSDGKALKGKYLEGQVGRHGDLANKSNLSRDYPPELTSAVVGPIPQCNGGVRVDLKGNLYVGMVAGAKTAPKGFEKDPAYQHCTGCIVKFGPDGGTVAGAADMMTGTTLDGAQTIYPGLAPFSHPHLGTTCCVCRIPRFDVDRYGRLVIPNATGNYVQLVDNAGNEIFTFGHYGNFDSQYLNPATATGKAGRPSVAVPAIPLAWPNGAGLSDRSIYVLDVYAHRVVRADLTWQAEDLCALP